MPRRRCHRPRKPSAGLDTVPETTLKKKPKKLEEREKILDSSASSAVFFGKDFFGFNPAMFVIRKQKSLNRS